jgi:hypothetical protein
MRRTYRGCCHCGRIVFELDAEIGGAIDCNCSLCSRRGALWHAAIDGELRIVEGASELTAYRFLTHTATHLFCRHCGIHPFARPRLDPSRWVVNLRCIDDIDLTALRVHPFDGEHWEDAAAALLSARRASAGAAHQES